MAGGAIFERLGFCWDRNAIIKPEIRTADIAIKNLKRNLPRFVWETGVLENNPFTYVEVQTFLDGITVGGHKISDEDQIRGIADSARKLIEMVKDGSFDIQNISTIKKLHYVLAKNEALDAGKLRGEGEAKGTLNVFLGELGDYTPPNKTTDGKNLEAAYNLVVEAINTIENPLEKGIALFLFLAKEQPFFDGNKRVGRLMMNGVLMASGVNAISIPAKQQQPFNQHMINFYKSCAEKTIGNANDMMTFMTALYKDDLDRENEAGHVDR